MIRDYFLNKQHFRDMRAYQSNMKCKICGGWGGDFGDAKGVGPMCSSCYYKTYGTYD